MNRGALKVAFVVGACLALGAALFGRTPAPEPASAPEKPAMSDSRAARIFDMAAMRPDMPYGTMSRLADDSDRIRERLGSSDDEAVGRAVRQRLRDVHVSEQEARKWYAEHREIFGRRSFEESRFSVERLVAIERVRAELALDEER